MFWQKKKCLTEKHVWQKCLTEKEMLKKCFDMMLKKCFDRGLNTKWSSLIDYKLVSVSEVFHGK